MGKERPSLQLLLATLFRKPVLKVVLGMMLFVMSQWAVIQATLRSKTTHNAPQTKLIESIIYHTLHTVTCVFLKQKTIKWTKAHPWYSADLRRLPREPLLYNLILCQDRRQYKTQQAASSATSTELVWTQDLQCSNVATSRARNCIFFNKRQLPRQSKFSI